MVSSIHSHSMFKVGQSVNVTGCQTKNHHWSKNNRLRIYYMFLLQIGQGLFTALLSVMLRAMTLTFT